ncbi:hypothetical protein F5B21DRAFT_521444 [Xylaria acuta]|nr:hypothetical protein F5B21DRAFT_521444 [Xylaria acuta]
MGVKYLWIDRLCVIQGSDADKAIQLPQMDLVYSSACLTIVAASGTAHTARVEENLSVMNILRLDDAYETCAWRTRGWTFQEGLCSQRALVITRDQVFWSCETARCCEIIAFEDFPTAVKPGDSVASVLSGHRVFGEFGGANFNYGELRSMIAASTGDTPCPALFDLSLAWANIVFTYDAELSDDQVPARRRDTHLVRAVDRSIYDISLLSWSWLGWMHPEGVMRVIPKQVNIAPELNIMKLDVYGKAAPLNTSENKLEDPYPVNMYGIDASTSAGWKRDTTSPPHLLHVGDGDEFRDSGRLFFWTSHAELETREGNIPNCSSKEEMGSLLPLSPY